MFRLLNKTLQTYNVFRKWQKFNSLFLQKITLLTIVLRINGLSLRFGEHVFSARKAYLSKPKSISFQLEKTCFPNSTEYVYLSEVIRRVTFGGFRKTSYLCLPKSELNIQTTLWQILQNLSTHRCSK